MAEPSLIHAEAEAYLLGQMSPAEQRQFEARLSESSGLRELVRELEGGVVALAMSAPLHAAPREAWEAIESELVRRSFWKLLLPFTGLKWAAKGWATAAGLTTACVLHLLWLHQPVAAPEVQVAMAGRQVAYGAGADERVSGARGLAETAAPPTGYARERQLAGHGREDVMDGLALNVAGGAMARPYASGNLRAVAECARSAGSYGRASWAAGTDSGWAGKAGKRRGETATNDLAWDNAPNFDPNNPGGCSSGTGNGGGTFSFMWSGGTNEAFNDGTNELAIPIWPVGTNVVALINPGLWPGNTTGLTVWELDAAGDQTVVETLNPGGGTGMIVLPDLDFADGYQYIITPAGDGEVLGEFPPDGD